MEEDKLKQEQAELNRLINNGIKFYINDIEDIDVPWYKRLFRKQKERIVEREFIIRELTLSTQDRISAEVVCINKDLAALDDNAKGNSSNIAKELMSKHGKRCAKIIAIAVINSSNLIKTSNGLRIPDPDVIDKHANLFYRALKPSQLYEMFKIIEIMRNLGDFTHSIRLISEVRTAAPTRIE